MTLRPVCPLRCVFVTLLAVELVTALPARGAGSSGVGGPEAGALARVARAEYDFSPAAEGATAPNRRHALRVRIAPAGLTVTAREDEARFRLELTLRAIGRGAPRRAIASGEVALDGARAEIRRDGVTEWFVNTETGLEHGLILDDRPAGEGQLTLAFALGGGLAAVGAGARDLVLRDARGRDALRYGALAVFDAHGRPVPARFRLAPGTIEIEIEDGGAVYPLTVDPLLTAPGWDAEGVQAGAAFARSLAAAGDVNGDGWSDVLVGAPLFDAGAADAGRAQLFLGSAAGLSPTPAWTIDGTQAGQELGAAVAWAGDVNADGFDDIAVSSPSFDGAFADEGRVQVWYGSASGPGVPADWTAEGGAAGIAFGRALAGAGDVDGDGDGDLLVGAPLSDAAAADGGRAVLFAGSPGGLATTPAWTVDGAQAGEELGAALAGAADIDGDGFADVLVGAPRHDAPDPDEGRARLYRGSAAGLGTTPSWTTDGEQAGARHGAAVALPGDVDGDGFADALVGAPLHDDTAGADEGRARAYSGGAAGLATAAAWTVDGGQAGAQFGAALGGAGDADGDGYADALVGAPLFNGAGRAFAFLGGVSGLSPSSAWTTDGAEAGAEHGAAIGGAGDADGDGFSDALVGAPGGTGAAGAGAGKATLSRGAGAAPAAAPAWSARGAQPGGYFGYKVDAAGDVNGDGFADLAVGAYLFDGGQIDEGKVFVFHGSAAGPSAAPNWTFESDQAGAHAGVAATSAGDVDGDGYDDLVVGAPYFANGQLREGRVWVFRGSPSGLAAAPAWVRENDQFDSRFGVAAAGAGDVNGDGYADVAVGALFFDDDRIDEGRAYLFLGGPQGLGKAPVWHDDGDANNASYGFRVAAAGDVNGDGFDDVMVGARLWRGTRSSEGRAVVYFGSPTGPAPSPSWSFAGGATGAEAGSAVASAGDVNGDGFADVLVGALGHTGDLTREGRAYLFFGSPSGPSLAPDWLHEGNQLRAEFGSAVAGAGDVNGDGFGDVLVGARLHDGGQTDEGRVSLFLGSATGLAVSPALTAEINQAGALLGQSVAGVGDIDGDGLADIAAGAHLFDDPNTDSGRAYVWYGNNGGLERRPRQARADGSAPVAWRGRSDAAADFRLRALARSPLGRDAVRLEWELKPFDAPFDGADLARTAEQGTGSAFDQLASGLDTRPFKWRARLVSRHPLAPRSPWLAASYGPLTTPDLRGGGCILRTYYADADGDGYGDAGVTVDACAQPAGYVPFAGDCADGDAAAWASAGELHFLKFSTRTTLTWSEPADRGGSPGTLTYDTLRSTSPADFTAAACVEPGGADLTTTDTAVPAAGSQFAYLVRAVNACGPGALGAAADGTPRSAPPCP